MAVAGGGQVGRRPLFETESWWTGGNIVGKPRLMYHQTHLGGVKRP